MRPYTPISPGSIILKEMRELEITEIELATKLNLSIKEMHDLLNSHLMIDSTIAAKLSEVFGCSPEYYLNLEQEYRCDLFC